MLWAVSRAPLATLAGIQAADGPSPVSNFVMGPTTTFRRDDPVTNSGRAGTPASGPAEFAAMTGTDVGRYTREREGMSAFALDDGGVYRTYSTYTRGVDALWGMYPWLDRAPKGLNETGAWVRRYNEHKGYRVSLNTGTIHLAPPVHSVPVAPQHGNQGRDTWWLGKDCF